MGSLSSEGQFAFGNPGISLVASELPGLSAGALVKPWVDILGEQSHRLMLLAGSKCCLSVGRSAGAGSFWKM